MALVFADSDDYPALADATADFVYARLQRSVAAEEAGYAAADLDLWARRARDWAAGGVPAGLPFVEAKPPKAAKGGRDVFVFFISAAKERNPAAAMALLRLPGLSGPAG